MSLKCLDTRESAMRSVEDAYVRSLRVSKVHEVETHARHAWSEAQRAADDSTYMLKDVFLCLCWQIKDSDLWFLRF
jgi:hypothetical protein